LVSPVVPVAWADVPQIVVTPPQHATADAVEAVWSPLLGSSPGVPTQSPVSWMVLAAARRQFGQQRTASVPAATVPTGQMLSPAAPVTAAAAVTAVAVTNSPPVISNVTLAIPNTTTGAVVGTVKATDANGDTMTYKASVTSAGKGTVAITTAGVFTYTPTVAARHAAAKAGATAATTTDTVTVTVTDAKGAAVTQAVTVTVSPKNTAPTGAKATVGTPNATTGIVTGTVTATDADKDPLTYTAPASTSKGTVAITAAGAFTYTPTTAARQNAGKTGATAADKSDTFTVTVTDGYGGTTTVAVSVAVSPVAANRAPIAGTPTVGNPNASTGAITGAVKATDADGDSLTYLGSITTSKGSAVVDSGGTFTYTPTATARHAAAKIGASTSDRTDGFTVTVSDGKGGTATIPVTVTISPANAAPVAGTPSATINPTTGSVVGNVNAFDPDKDPLTYVAGSATTAKGTATVTANGAYTYTPTAVARHNAAIEGATVADTTDVFIVDVADNYGALSSISFGIAVSPFNTAPSALITSQSGSDPVTGIVTGSMTVSDADGDDVYYSVLTSTSKGSVSYTSDGNFTYTPTTDARNAAASSSATAADKTDTFSVTFTDDYGGSTAVPVTVAISPAIPGVTVSFTQGSASAVEGNSGVTRVPLTVQLSAPSSVPVTVRYAVVEQPLFSSAATPGEDFLSETGSVTIPVGQTEGTFQISVYGDTKYESDELVRVELIGVSGGVLDSSYLNYRKTVTIVNDDQPSGAIVSFKQGSVSSAEGNSGSTQVPVTVQLSAPSAGPVTVRYAVVEQPLFSTAATPGEDFLAQTGSITIPAGQTEGTFLVTIYGDTKYENDELVRVELTSVTGGVLDSSYLNFRKTLTIVNDDQPAGALVSFRPASVSVNEGNSGLTKAVLTVQLSAPSAGPVTVYYAVVEQPLFSTAATPGEDFLAQTGSVTIAAGQTEASFQITIYGDTKYEADELVRVELTSVAGGVLDSNPSNYRQTVTIKNDDLVPGLATVRATETSL
jgi:VCBS repeat-containing protein